MAKKTQQTVTQLPTNDVGYACFRLIGESPLLVHKFSQKAFEMMLAGMTGYALPRDPKDLEKEFQQSRILNVKEIDSLPPRYIRCAMESSTPRSKKMVAATVIRSSVFVMGHSLPVLSLDGSPAKASIQKDVARAGKPIEPVKQIDIVRVGSFNNRVPDVRARARFDDWMLEIVVRFFPDQIELRQVAWALDAAGKYVGLCEWRPEKSGDYGTFRVEALPESHYDRILKQSSIPMPQLQVPSWLMTAAQNAGLSPAAVIEEAKRSGGKRKSNGAAAHV